VEIGVLEVLVWERGIAKANVFLREAIINARKVFLKRRKNLVVMMTAVDRWKKGDTRYLIRFFARGDQ
jgi:hypothetical protein